MSVPRSSKVVGQQHHETFETIYPGTAQAVAFNGTSVQSSAMQASTTLVRIFATQDCFIKVGVNPTAIANSSMFVPGGIIDFIGVQPGDKIAVIRSSSDGTLYLTEGA